LRQSGLRQGRHLVIQGRLCRAIAFRDVDVIQGLLPILVAFLSENDVSRYLALPSHHDPDDVTSDPEKRSHTKSIRLLLVATASASIVLATGYEAPPTFALSFSSVIFTAIGLVLFESALRDSKGDNDAGRRGLMSANGTFARRNSLQSAAHPQDPRLASWRDVAFIMTVICTLASYVTEPVMMKQAVSWQPSYRHWRGDWQGMHYSLLVQQNFWMICVNLYSNIVLSYMVSKNRFENCNNYISHWTFRIPFDSS
jgi:hypothetical protein